MKREWSFFPWTVRFLQHLAFPLWEEVGSSAPGGLCSPFLLSDGSLRSPLLLDTVNSHSSFLCCLLLGQIVLDFCINQRVWRPNSVLSSSSAGLSYCLTLLSIPWPRSSLHLDSVTYFGVTFGSYGQSLLSSSFWVGSALFRSTCLWLLMS